MATVNKDFKIKNGLIVEGTNGTINGYDILTKDTDDQNYIIGLIGGSATPNNTPDTVVLRDNTGSFAAETITVNEINVNDVLRVEDDGGDIIISNTDGGDIDVEADDIRIQAQDDVTISGNDIRIIPTGNVYISPSANYTEDTQVVTREFLGDLSIDGVSHTVTSKIAAAKSEAITDANSYTDGRETAITTAYQSYTDNAINALDTDDIEEGVVNLYFSNTLARGAVSAGEGLNYNSSTGEFTAHLGNGLEILNGAIQIDDTVVATDSDVTSAISTHNASSGVHGVTGDIVGTTDTQTISNKTLGSNLDAGTYTVTNLGTPTNSTDAATKAYVDAVSEGLHIHASAAAATTANISLSPAPATIDGVTLTNDMRVLVKNQSTASQNGIYVYSSSTGNLTRAADFDAPAEVDGGDFIFVTGGTVNDNTGWVQTSELVATIGVDPIYFTQFSGAGQYLAGNGLILDGNTFEIDDSITATVSYVDTELDAHIDLTSSVHGVTGSVVGTTDTQTLTHKTLGASTALGANLDAVNTYTIANLQEPSNNQDAATKYYVDTAVSGVQSDVDNLTTDDISEGTNLFYTDARVRDVLTTSIQTNISITEVGNDLVITAENGVGDSDTDDLVEGTSNLYFTNARAEAAMVTPLTTGTQTNITVTYDNVSGTYDFVAENGVADSNTDDLTEGTSNLYFTNARAVAALEAVTPNFVEIDINEVATQVAATLSAPTAGAQSAYSWDAATYRSAEFLVKVAYGSHTEVSKVLITLDTSNNIAITEYAIVGTNGSASSISAVMSSGSVVLQVTTVNNNSTVTVAGTLLV